jgi:cob(I)alamin adenosyltransferase
MMKIYTRTGDRGQTALYGGGRVSKDHPRVEAYGTVDELNAQLGWAATQVSARGIRERLELLQSDMFVMGSILASPPPEGGRPAPSLPELPAGRVQEMERWIDEAMEPLPPLRNFVLPGGSAGAAALHVARTVCRRAERAVVQLDGQGDGAPENVVFLNRLSDLLFAWSRLENHRVGQEDVVWRGEPV